MGEISVIAKFSSLVLVYQLTIPKPQSHMLFTQQVFQYLYLLEF